MNNPKLEILQELLVPIDQKNFDIEAWKIKASLVLKRIFGNDDSKASLVDSLHYDYSSWSLRDHSGNRQIDPVKDKAKEIIESAILELRLSDQEPPVMEVIKGQLTGEEFDQLQLLVKNKESDEVSLTEYFSKIASAKKDQALAKIILKLI